MVRATTPTLTLHIADDSIDLTEARAVYVTVAQGATVITKTGDDLEVSENSVSCRLTQEESLTLRPGTAEVQVNWTYLDLDSTTRRASTTVKTIRIEQQLLQEGP